MKTLIIAEKPSVARDIARVLKVTSKGDGYIYNSAYIISWAIGHLVTLKEPEEYNPALKKWRMHDLPIIPSTMEIKALPKTAKQLNLLKKMLNSKEVSSIISATDSGREGELIFRFIYAYAGSKKPVKRLWISSLTDTAIKDGLDKMKDGGHYDNLFHSARCRAWADWLVGMNATRAFTIKGGELYTMGRVQTPTLAILVNRQVEIDHFVPEEYWEVEGKFTTQKDDAPGEEYTGLYLNPAINTEKAESAGEGKPKQNPHRIPTKEAAAHIAKTNKNQPATITNIVEEEKRQPPPQLFDLTELQREANRRLGLSAKDTLTIAQALYETHKMITYPRTDSRYLSADMTPKLKPTLLKLPEPYAALAAPLLSGDKLPITSRIINDKKVTDHHAIIPTGSSKSLASLNPRERSVYDLVLRNFIAAFYPAYVYSTTTVTTRVDTTGDCFISKGKMDKSLGWKAVYGSNDTAAGKKEKEIELPTMAKNQPVLNIATKSMAKKTTPPKPYTEATLLSAMENAGRFVEDEDLKEALKASGLGTPATRAAMIEKLISSQYVTRSKKNLVPTPKGMKVISLVPKEMKAPETTGKWEKGLTRIAQGELDPEKFMASIQRYVGYLVQEANKI